MSQTNDQVDSPKEPVEHLSAQTIENEIKKAEKEASNKNKEVKVHEKEDKEDYWVIWGQLVTDWDQYKKNTQYVKVSLFARKKCL